MSPRARLRRGAAARLLAAGLWGAAAGAPAAAVPAGGPGAPAEPDPTHLFHRARAAYDAGRVAEAAALYRRIRAAGYASAALDFNLGNAVFRAGDVAEAVRCYRRAWYEAPRDADVQANLAFALRTAGAPAPRAPPLARALFRLSRREWYGGAVAAYWLSVGATAAFLWTRRRAWLRVLAGSLALLACAAAGVAAWQRLAARPEAVVAPPGLDALFAPRAGTTAHFAAPAGMIVRLEGAEAGWYKVTFDGKTGWIPAEAARPLTDP